MDDVLLRKQEPRVFVRWIPAFAGILKGQLGRPSPAIVLSISGLSALAPCCCAMMAPAAAVAARSEEHTSELQSLMRISYAVFCLKKKTNNHIILSTTNIS